MIINKNINDYNTFDIDLIEDDKVLSIYQTGLDINISCRYDKYKKIETIDFNISKNQEMLYSIFNKLYENILSANILDEDIQKDEVKRKIESLKQMTYYKSLVKDRDIIILSDAYPINCPNILKITKKDEMITLTFTKVEGNVPKMPYIIPIHIRQSGSRIYEFSIPFKTIFNELQYVEEKEKCMKKIKKYNKNI